MCTIAILVDVLADAPVAIAANRDEFHARPARAPVALAPGVVGGRDELLGGSWLAFSVDGRFAAVTNQREPIVGRAPRSRGAWVTGLLAAGDRRAMAAFVDALDPRAYASGNLVYGDASGVEVAYLRRDGGRARRALPPGLTVLANDRVDAPGQPKQARLRGLLAGAHDLASFAAIAPTALADHAVPAELPPLAPGLPVPPEAWGPLQAVCVHAGPYGTRSATVAALVPGGIAALAWADGPPCTTAFTDARPRFATLGG
ncbi:MAG: NRDE family protein [Myxococcales bacterium]|nr:NRDE family protein [Myxococcales bacterium]MBK7198402.1 NRDE family protein [Myxococcales bacterium]MBP6842082.1 NRDE family protein [Kofleriaceae bacterium]